MEANEMNHTRKILLTLIATGTLGGLGALGVFSAFSATTTNSGNSASSGTVTIADSDGSVALYSTTDMKPGDTAVKCIRVTYTGSLTSTVKLYTSAAITSGTQFNLQIERGSGLSAAYPSCTGFSSASSIYNGDLGSFGTSYAAGVDAKGSTWAQNDTVDYRFTLTQNDDATANAHTSVTTTGSHTFTWEARNS